MVLVVVKSIIDGSSDEGKRRTSGGLSPQNSFVRKKRIMLVF